MILQPARIVLIDDKQSHLKAIADALGLLGSASLSFLYKDEHPAPEILAGVRLIFCDLHLGSDAKTTDTKTYCSNIASMLASSLAEDHGPYLLIIWSQFPNEVDSLKGYLDELEPGQRPFSFVCLDKNAFINVGDGTVLEGADLPGEIRGIVSKQPGLAAMLNWEQTASVSAAKVTNSLWKLAVDKSKTDPDKALCGTLGKLAVSAAGEKLGEEAPGRSVLEALVPLLADQIEAHPVNEAVWKTAVDLEEKANGAPSEALYTALHIEQPTSYKSDSRGVVSYLEPLVASECFKDFFGYDQGTLLMQCGFQEKDDEESKKNGRNIMKVKDGLLGTEEWFLVQINAACDEAQDHPGLIPFCLAALVPNKKTNKNGKQSVQATEPFLFRGRKTSLYLMGRFVIGLTKNQSVKLEPQFRLRSSLLDKLIFGLRTNAARLGVTEP